MSQYTVQTESTDVTAGGRDLFCACEHEHVCARLCTCASDYFFHAAFYTHTVVLYKM